MRVSRHTAQASTKAPLSTQRYLFNIGVLLISGMTQMVDLKIDCGVRSAIGQFYDMATMLRRIFGNRLITGKTQAVLLSPDAIRLRLFLCRSEHFLIPAEPEILIPIEGMRVGSILILMCRTIGVLDSLSKVYSLALAPAYFSTVENTHRRYPRTLYRSLTHRVRLRGSVTTKVKGWMPWISSLWIG